MVNFKSITGRITQIENFGTPSSPQFGCTQMMSVTDRNGMVNNFILSPGTYFIDHAMVRRGDTVTAFYNADLPVPLIFPPQYQAVVVNVNSPYQSVKVDYFDSRLLSSDGTLMLNLARNSLVTLTNDQRFIGNPANHNLIVIYTASTRSIPAQTTPERVIVLC